MAGTQAQALAGITFGVDTKLDGTQIARKIGIVVTTAENEKLKDSLLCDTASENAWDLHLRYVDDVKSSATQTSRNSRYRRINIYSFYLNRCSLKY